MEFLPITAIKKHMEMKKMDKTLDGYDKLCDVSGVKLTEEQFDAELQVYSEIPGVEISPDVRQYYQKANSDIATSVNALKSERMQIKSHYEAAHSYEESIKKYKEHDKDYARQIREARRDYNKTIPFSREAKAKKQEIKRLKHSRLEAFCQTRETIRKRDRMVDKLKEREKAIKENQETIRKRTEQRNKIIASVRKQFKLVDKIRAQEQILKSIDPNTLSSEEAKKVKARSKYLLGEQNKIKISVLSPFKMYTDNDLLQLASSGDKANPVLIQFKAMQDVFSGKKITTKKPPMVLNYDDYLQAQTDTIGQNNSKKAKKMTFRTLDNLFSNEHDDEERRA